MKNENIITWHEATKFSRKNSGLEKTKCPNCNHQRTDKSDRSMSIQHAKGVAKCHYCQALAFREDRPPKAATPGMDYQIPDQQTGELNSAWIEFCEGRKIYAETIKKLGWSMENGRLCFNFYEGDTIVNKKYRTMDKKFMQSTGGKPIFYNINAARDAEVLYITEGEFDVAALYEIGIENVISMPSANVSDAHWENSIGYLKHIKKFVLAVDNDPKGEALRDELARRLGKHRCVWVDFNGKDANDDLMAGVLDRTIARLQHFKVENVDTWADIRDKAWEIFKKGNPTTFTPKCDSWGDWRENFSVLPGQLTIVTGIPGHGKSEFVDYYALSLIRDFGFRGAWFSPEHNPTEVYVRNFIQKTVGKPYTKMTDGEWLGAGEWLESRVHWRNVGDGWTTWDKLIETFDELVAVYNTKIFVIDAFNKVFGEKSTASELSEIRRALTMISNFAKRTESMVFLVAHPKKMDQMSEGFRYPTMYDISGSADFFNITDNGLVVYREMDNSVIVSTEKVKFNFQGRAKRKTHFKFNPDNGRYTTGSHDYTDWTKKS